MARHQIKIRATVFIPTYNGEDHLEDLLHMVFSQKLNDPFEVFIIDSGSTDNTLKIIEKFPSVMLHQIPNSEFGHGKTRNLAAHMSNGEFMVYLSQDAVPAHDRWLEFMLEPFSVHKDVFCVFGKQSPRPTTDAPTKRMVKNVFTSLGPDHSIMINRKNSLITGESIGNHLTFLSDVNSAVRRAYLLEKIHYRDVPYAEDQLLGKDALDNNYLKAYAPLGNVVHSNDYGVKEYFYRQHDEAMALFETLGTLPSGSPFLHLKYTLVDSIRDFIFILRDNDYSLKRKVLNTFTSPLRNALRHYVAYLVAKESHRKKVGRKYSLEAKKTAPKG